MKYKFLSVLVVLSTMLSVSAMLLSRNSLNPGNEQNNSKSNVSQSIPQKSNSSGVSKEKSSNSSLETGNIIQKEEESNSKVNVNSNDKAEVDTIPNQQSFIVIDKRNSSEAIDSGEVSQSGYPDSTAVFKVESSTIEDSLSIMDKAKLLGVATKISPVDYARIYNYLYDENSARGIINTFRLLKTRLSNSDYDKIKDIASQYMDVDCIENYVN